MSTRRRTAPAPVLPPLQAPVTVGLEPDPIAPVADASTHDARHGALRGHLWPGRPQPFRDELVSSWLARLAAANGLTTRALVSQLAASRATVDLDRGLPLTLVAALAARTGIVPEVLDALGVATSLSPVRSIRGRARTPLLLPTGTAHRDSYNNIYPRYGLQYCPDCLATDRTPYFRRHWRFGWSVVCATHERLLIDRCPACDAPVAIDGTQPRRPAPAKDRPQPTPPRSRSIHLRPTDNLLLTCVTCGHDRRTPSRRRYAQIVPESIPPTAVDDQRRLETIFTRGTAEIGTRGTVTATVQFQALRTLMGVLAAGHDVTPVRVAGWARYHIPAGDIQWPYIGADAMIEQLRPQYRAPLVALACRFLDDWPIGFADLLLDTDAWTAAVIWDQTTRGRPSPTWLWDSVRHYYEEHRLAAHPPMFSDPPRRPRFALPWST